MKLSTHFSLEEMIKSQTAIRKNIDNTPNAKQVENLKNLCEMVLEKIRAHFDKSVTINSGFRSKKLNTATGGSKSSQHMTGQAADIEISGIDNLILTHWIADNLEFDQLISEFYVPGITDSGWVHVSWNSSGNRKQRITINKFGTATGLPAKN